MKNAGSARNFQAETTMNRLVQQAMRLFLEKGYHGTSIDDITQAAGLTKGALYWHFKGKEDLLKKIVDEFEKRFLNGLIQSVGEIQGGALEKFDKYFRYNAAFAYHNRDLCVSFTTLGAELVGADPAIESEFRRIYKKYKSFLSTLIFQGKREKVFKKDLDTDLTALVVIAFHDGILHQWSMNRNEVDGKAYVETFKKVILNGLMA